MQSQLIHVRNNIFNSLKQYSVLLLYLLLLLLVFLLSVIGFPISISITFCIQFGDNLKEDPVSFWPHSLFIGRDCDIISFPFLIQSIGSRASQTNESTSAVGYISPQCLQLQRWVRGLI